MDEPATRFLGSGLRMKWTSTILMEWRNEIVSKNEKKLFFFSLSIFIKRPYSIAMYPFAEPSVYSILLHIAHG